MPCPICKQNMTFFERYPDKVCSECSEKTLTNDGVKIDFYNIDITGGFKSIIQSKPPALGKEHKCFINGLECYADEARFGGIVVSLKI
jgi:hypothetical protein